MSATSLALPTLADTQALAARLAPALRAGDCLLLSGTLGTGKTSFAQALIPLLCGQAVEVTSPTFTLVQHYPATAVGGVYHYDLYRIEHPDALVEIGLDEAETGLRIIEWPQRLGAGFTPGSWLHLHFTMDNGIRTVTLNHGGALSDRLKDAA